MNTLTCNILTLGATAALVAGVAVTTGGTETVTTGCVIRFYSDGPALHQNPAHKCDGATGVWIHDNGSLVIDQTHDAPVVGVTAQSDETLGPRLIFPGVSGAVQDSHIIFTDVKLGRALDLTNPADYQRLVGPYSNIWWSVTQEVGR